MPSRASKLSRRKGLEEGQSPNRGRIGESGQKDIAVTSSRDHAGAAQWGHGCSARKASSDGSNNQKPQHAVHMSQGYLLKVEPEQEAESQGLEVTPEAGRGEEISRFCCCCYFKPQVMEKSLKGWLTARNWIRFLLSGRMQAWDRDKVQQVNKEGYIFAHHLVALENIVHRSIFFWGENLSFLTRFSKGPWIKTG